MVSLLAALVALSPAWGDLRLHRHDATEDGHLHHHHHVHDGEAHAHTHHHHDGEETDGGDHHHDLSDLPPDGAMARWTAPRRMTAAPPPMMPAPAVLSQAPAGDRKNLAREKPPPRQVRHDHQAICIRTVILLV